MPDPLDVSVLMPVYAGVASEHLDRSLASVFAQTRLPAEVVVVEDGPLTEDQLAVLDTYSGRTPPLKRVRIAVNSGPGVANGAGLAAATASWVAKMDADDICVPQRLERQLAELGRGELDVLGSAMAEFEHDEHTITAVRRAPRTHDEIARRMRMNNPLNHPTIVFDRALALRVGGYPDLRFLEDYDLMARMLAAGARMGNLPEPLVLFRADEGMYLRRTLPELTACERVVQRNLVAYGLVGPVRARVNLVARLVFRRLPPRVLRLAYRVLFQRSPER